MAACASRRAVALVGAPIEHNSRAFIASLRVEGSGVSIAYRKTHLGGEEPHRFSPGDGPTILDLNGLRVGVGICRDTGTDEHVEGIASLGVDVYAAGLVHLPQELWRTGRPWETYRSSLSRTRSFREFRRSDWWWFVTTAGRSTVWDADGAWLARAGADPGELIRARIS